MHWPYTSNKIKTRHSLNVRFHMHVQLYQSSSTKFETLLIMTLMQQTKTASLACQSPSNLPPRITPEKTGIKFQKAAVIQWSNKNLTWNWSPLVGRGQGGTSAGDTLKSTSFFAMRQCWWCGCSWSPYQPWLECWLFWCLCCYLRGGCTMMMHEFPHHTDASKFQGTHWHK